MHLQTLVVSASEFAKVPKDPPLRWFTHHVAEIFMALLPSKFDLDGCGKLRIYCGPRNDEPVYQTMLGVSLFYAEKFDFGSFFALTPRDREAMTLSIIQQSMHEIVATNGGDRARLATIDETTRLVQERGFDLQMDIDRLSRNVPGKKGTSVNVVRCLNGQVGEAWRADVVQKDGKVLASKWMTPTPQHLDMTEHFKKSKFVDLVYVVTDRFAKSIFELDVGSILKI